MALNTPIRVTCCCTVSPVGVSTSVVKVLIVPLIVISCCKLYHRSSSSLIVGNSLASDSLFKSALRSFTSILVKLSDRTVLRSVAAGLPRQTIPPGYPTVSGILPKRPSIPFHLPSNYLLMYQQACGPVLTLPLLRLT